MLDRIREGSQSLWVKVFLVLIALTFALAGIGGYIANQPEPAVAVVNGEDITQVEFERAVESERNRQQQQLGDFYEQLARDPRYTQRIRAQVVNDLINQKLLEQAARDRGLRASPEQVKAAIRDISGFKVAGQFDNDLYLTTLRSMGYTPDGFAELIRRDLITQQLVRGIVGSEFVLPSEVDNTLQLLGQERSGAFTQIAWEDYRDQVEISDADIETWYNQNLQNFAVPEQVKVEYVLIDGAELAEQLEVSEEDARAYYEGNLSRYEDAPRYRFSHILIESGDDPAAAEAEAEALLAEIEQGADFAELAQANSDDIFSGEQGGDLEWIEPGTMDADFEEAAFALENIGDITGVVETSFGYHIIKLTDKEEGSVTPFEEVRAEIAENLREQQVQNRYYELQQEVAKLAFEVPDTFSAVTEATGLTAQTSDWFSEGSARGALAAPAVVQEVFSNEMITDRFNSDIIEISDTESVVVRVVDHKDATTQPLSEVTDQVRQALTVERAQELALQRADAIATAVRSGEATDAEFTEVSNATRQSSEYPRMVVQTLFGMAAPAADSSNIDTVTLENGDIAVVRLDSVSAGQVDAEQSVQLQEQLLNNYSQEVYSAVINALRGDAEIEMLLNQSNDSETSQ